MDRETELKEFFDFLVNNKESHEIKKSDLIFGLENYALNLSEDVMKRITEDIERHKAASLNFEDFKNLWKHNVEKTTLSTRETSEQLFNLILDSVFPNPLELKDKINAEALKKAILALKIDWRGKAKYSKSSNDIEQLVDDMIRAIDIDGDGQISLADFEFMMKFFNESELRNDEYVMQTGNTTANKK